MSKWGYRAGGVALGLILDRALGDPPDAWHPTAWFGTAMGRLEARIHADRHSRGALYALTGVGLAAAAGLVLHRVCRRTSRSREHSIPWDVALAVAIACSGRTLRDTGGRIQQYLEAGELEAARAHLPWLVGRDPRQLDASGIAAAVVESLAENTVDAVIAPVFWAILGGAPGVLIHRAVNTMDAMVGHRNPRYRRFGTVAARADDVMAWIPARVLAGLVALLHDPRQAQQVLRVVRRDAPPHPSPNSGVAEAAVAAALGVELGGPVRYGDRVEERPRLGQGPRPQAVTIGQSRILLRRVEDVVIVAGLLGCHFMRSIENTVRASTKENPCP